jgi:pyruvate kinase
VPTILRDPFQSPCTRILATLGPSSWAPPAIRALVDAGASGFRLNFSFAEYEILREVVRHIRAISAERRIPLAILGDLGGPKLRTGRNLGGAPILLTRGDEVRLSGSAEHSVARCLAVSHAGLAGDVRPGDAVLLDDGRIRLRVARIDVEAVVCLVEHGGSLGSGKGLNIPGRRLSLPALTEKDVADLRFALENDLDFIAQSFVQEARDVADLKSRIARAAKSTPVIAKIEKPLAVENLEEIMDISDGIMVARGDLGVEIGTENLPMVQKQIIGAARARGKLVITATQMLDSMTYNPSPTRAEASDVANAICDGADVVMLSQETAVGHFPALTVETMRKIATTVEGSEAFQSVGRRIGWPRGDGVASAAIRAACVAAEDVGARALIAFSTSGWTAFAVASLRPRTSIYACTHSPETWRRLALCWGARPVLIRKAETIDDMYLAALETLAQEDAVARGDAVVVLAGSVMLGSGANTIKINRLGTGEFSDDPAAQDRLHRLFPRHLRADLGDAARP